VVAPPYCDLLAQLKGLSAGKIDPTEHSLPEARSRFEEGQFVDKRRHEAMRVIKCRGRTLATQVLKILDASGRQHGREDFSRSVVDQVTPGVSAGQLEAIRKTSGNLGRCAVICRITV